MLIYRVWKRERDDAGTIETWAADFASRNDAFDFARARAGSATTPQSEDDGWVTRGNAGTYVVTTARRGA